MKCLKVNSNKKITRLQNVKLLEDRTLAKVCKNVYRLRSRSDSYLLFESTKLSKKLGVLQLPDTCSMIVSLPALIVGLDQDGSCCDLEVDEFDFTKQ